MMQVHVEPPPTPLIKSKHGDKSDKDFVKLKLCRYLISAKSDLYEFKMALFDNGDMEEFFLFVRKFNMTLVVSGTLVMVTKVHYIHTLVHGESLYQFDMLSYDVEVTDSLTV